MAKITIDNVDYDTEKLSDDAKAQLISIQYVDQELARLQAVNQRSIFSTNQRPILSTFSLG